MNPTKPTKHYPADALFDDQLHADLNNDGRIDVLPKLSPENTPERILPPDKYYSDFGGLKTATGGLIRFQPAPPEISRLCGVRSVVTCTDPTARFYVQGRTLSFVSGQKVQAVNDQGRLDQVFTLTGIALQFREGTVDLVLHENVKPLLPQYFGYGTYKGKIIEVPLGHLRWTIGVSETIDPEHLRFGGTPSNVAETLLQPLFQEVAKLPNQFPGNKQRAARLQQFNLLVENWKRSVTIVDVDRTALNRSAEIMKDPLWTGILHALAKLAGLTLADFPG